MQLRRGASMPGGDLLYQSLACVLAHLLNLLAASSRAHGPGVTIVVLLLLELDMGAVARDDDGAAGLSAPQARAHGGVARLGLVLVADRAGAGGGAHVVRVRGPSVDVEDCNGRVGSRG
jgi:hypothetical protein